MGLFLLFLFCQMITLDDIQEYFSDILNIKEGVLTRTQYFVCTWMTSWVIAAIGSVFLANVLNTSLTGTRDIRFYLGYGTLLLIITLIHLSAFCRRMNDAQLSKWYALVFLVPGIGNILALLVALMPSGFGSPY